MDIKLPPGSDLTAPSTIGLLVFAMVKSCACGKVAGGGPPPDITSAAFFSASSEHTNKLSVGYTTHLYSAFSTKHENTSFDIEYSI